MQNKQREPQMELSGSKPSFLRKKKSGFDMGKGELGTVKQVCDSNT